MSRYERDLSPRPPNYRSGVITTSLSEKPWTYMAGLDSEWEFLPRCLSRANRNDDSQADERGGDDL